MRLRRRTNLLTLLVSAAALALGAGPLTEASAQSVGAPPSTGSESKPKNPLAGDGMWIWYLSRSSHGKVGKIAGRAHRYGIETVLIKSGDGTKYWSQFSSGMVNALHARGLNVCAWQFIYGRNPTKEARVGAAAAARGADCLVLDVEGQYEGKYIQASTYMATLRSLVGPDYPLGLASFPYVDYHPALPFSVFLGPNGAQYNIPQLYWKEIGTTVDQGYIHTWVWNRIYQRPIDPLGQVYSNPKAGQVRRFRALALSHGFEGVSWWDWQEARNSQWKAISTPVAPASTQPYPSYPFLHLGLEGGLRRLGAAAARRRRLLARDQRLLPGAAAGRRLPVPGRPRPAADRQPRRPDLGRLAAVQAGGGHLDRRRRGCHEFGRALAAARSR